MVDVGGDISRRAFDNESYLGAEREACCEISKDSRGKKQD